MQIRNETPEDFAAVHALHVAAFPTAAEADLVDRLRKAATPLVSLVADHEGTVAGHILFSPVTLATTSQLLMGLAPMAVSPALQGQGVGAALVNAGIARCRATQAAAIFVLGHADYYPRFQFEPAAAHDINSQYDVPAEYFMVLELIPATLSALTGTVKFHPEFSQLT